MYIQHIHGRHPTQRGQSGHAWCCSALARPSRYAAQSVQNYLVRGGRHPPPAGASLRPGAPCTPPLAALHGSNDSGRARLHLRQPCHVRQQRQSVAAHGRRVLAVGSGFSQPTLVERRVRLTRHPSSGRVAGATCVACSSSAPATLSQLGCRFTGCLHRLPAPAPSFPARLCSPCLPVRTSPTRPAAGVTDVTCEPRKCCWAAWEHGGEL